MHAATPSIGRRRLPSLETLVGVGIIVVATAVAALLLYQRLSPAPVAITQPTASATRGTITTSLTATGTAVGTSTSDLGFKATGRVAEVRVSVGDSVAAGQVLA